MTLHFQARWLGLLSLLLGLSAQAADVLVVGVYPYLPNRSLLAYHEKLAAHLHATLKRPVHIATAKDVADFGHHILAGDYELVLAPGHLVRLAQVEQGWHPLARYTPDTPVLLLARKEAADFTAASLKGRTLATPGDIHLVSLATENWLASQNLVARRDYKILEAPSVSSVIHALASGQADMAIATLASLNQARSAEVGQLRIVQEITTVPLLFFAVRPDTPPSTQTELQRALLAYQTPQSGRPIAADARDLAPMDAYLEQTRQLLQRPRAAAATTRGKP